jgi:putative ABC transport system permease protein
MRSVQVVSAMAVGLQTLRANPMRTILSILGVIMGVASLVAVLAIGDGVEAFARDQIEQTTDLQTVMIQPRTFDEVDGMPVPRSGWPVFTLDDVDGAGAAVGPLGRVAPLLQGRARMAPPAGVRPAAADSGAARPRLVMITATGPAAAEDGRVTIAAGRFFDQRELRDSAAVLVASDGLAKLVAGDAAPAGALGREVTLEGTAFRIVGVLAPRGVDEPFPSAVVPFSRAASAMAPASLPVAPQLMLRAVRVEDVDSVHARAERWAASRFGAGTWEKEVRVALSQRSRIEQAQQGILIFKVAMGSFAAIALLVGGIGIMNVLIASVVERTREIGIRKATGARHRDILVQFLSEAVAISGVGAVLGALLGLAGAFGATALIRHLSQAKLYAGFTWGTLLVAAAISILVGLAAGLYPALRAARLSPIEAIRHE